MADKRPDKRPARTITGVPLSHVHPHPDMVLVEQYDTTVTDSGLVLPDSARVVVHVAKKVGSAVKHVEKGDIVLLRDGGGSVTPVIEAKGKCFLLHGDAVAGVIRGYDWRRQAMEEIVAKA